MRRPGLILVLALGTSPLLAQERQEESTLFIPDSLQSRNSLTVVFDRNLNTYNWLDRIVLDTTVAGLSLSLRQQFLSNIIRTTPVPSTGPSTLISDQNSMVLAVQRPLTQRVDLQTEWSSLIYDDARGVGLSSSSFHSVLGGLGFRPLPEIALSSLGGYRWDNQGTNRDRGPALQLTGALRGLDLNGYRFGGQAQLHTDFVEPRRLEDHYAELGMQKQFLGLTRDSLRGGFFHRRREFYTNADSAIESRIEQIVALGNILDYEIVPFTLARVFFSVAKRGLDKDTRSLPGFVPGEVVFDTRIDEFRLSTFLEILHRSPDGRTTLAARLAYSERDESHQAKLPSGAPPNVAILWAQRNRQEQTKDNLARRTSLSGDLHLPLSLSDGLSVSGTASVLRYDTPSAQNVEDRDELLLALGISTQHRLSRVLDLEVSLEATQSHLVYLLKERSANNNTNTVLRISPLVTYHPSPVFRTVNQFEVLANYTVYDFEDQLAIARSFSYRQFTWLDSSAVDFTSRVGLDFFAYFKIYERGQLDWGEFTERLESSFLDRTLAVQLRFQPGSQLLFGVGFRYFSQSQHRHELGTRSLASFLRTIGPTCLVAWDVGRHSRIDFRGWYEERTLADGSTRTQPSMTLNLLVSL
jgi:hypothetical protein